jgi:DNA-binding NtrC family response regulator
MDAPASCLAHFFATQFMSIEGQSSSSRKGRNETPGAVSCILDFRGLIGDSPAMQRLCRTAANIAKRLCTVMVLGETGTGKEVIARYIHQCSERAGGPFVPVDCASLPEPLFESQLFGHSRGAFTGATRDSLGAIRSADGGTLFLDEVGELNLNVQAKLLRALQERAVVPVGESSAQPVDIRVICATNRDLQAMVKAGTFRQDLFFRLHVVVLKLPPLRDRREDVAALCRHFLVIQADQYGEKPKELSDAAIAALQAYNWPGNIRELSNAMEQAHVLAASNVIDLADLPPHIAFPVAAPADSAVIGDGPVHGNDLSMLEVERRAIADALKRTRFNKAAASRLLKMNVKRLNRRITRTGVELPGKSSEPL